MSNISAGVTTTTALVNTADTSGDLQLQVNGTTPSVTLKSNGAIGVGSTPDYGTSGQVLTSQGISASPTWATLEALPSQTGNDGKYLTTNGTTASWATVGGGSLLRVTTFTSSGTWTKGSGTNYILVVGVGGGGSGGGPRTSTTAGAGGGGAGGYFEKFASTSGITTATVTIGTGGAVMTTDGTPGNNGGNTSFVYGATTLTANGGNGGDPSTYNASGGVGGSATNGTINISGQGGMGGNYPNGTNGLPGTGGSSMFGFGGASNGNNNVQSATGYGAGGVGASGGSVGGEGTSGIVIVYEYA